MGVPILDMNIPRGHGELFRLPGTPDDVPEMGREMLHTVHTGGGGGGGGGGRRGGERMQYGPPPGGA